MRHSPDRYLYTGVFDRAVTYIWYKLKLDQIHRSYVIAMTKIWSKIVHIYDQSYDIAMMMRSFKLVHKTQKCTKMHCRHRYWKNTTCQVHICLVYDSIIITEQDMGWQIFKYLPKIDFLTSCNSFNNIFIIKTGSDLHSSSHDLLRSVPTKHFGALLGFVD